MATDDDNNGGQVVSATSIGITHGNIAKMKAVLSSSGMSIPDLSKVEIFEFEVAVPSPWIPVTEFYNSWENYDPSDPVNYPPLHVMKHPDGTVETKGNIGYGAHPAIACRLPVGHWPDSKRIYAGPDDMGNINVYAVRYDGYIDVIHAPGSPKHIFINCTFLSLDSRPQVLSCWPYQIRTGLKRPPAGVFVLKTSFGESKRTPSIVAGAAPNTIDWRFIQKQNGNFISIENITGLPYNQKTKIRIMIVGE